jgi:phytoene synthase
MQVCNAITRRSASNLALAFVLLPREKRAGMAALYAFCREVDDVVDEMAGSVEERRAKLAAWRADVRTACDQGQPRFPVNQELRPVIARYQLPFDLFDELLRGVEMDLEVRRYRDFEALDLYCYRVASVVGLLSIEILGYQDPACRDYAVYLGKALQLTNILRDVRLDAARDHIYLPLSELERHGVQPQEILHFEYSSRFRDVAQSVADRARGFYRAARESLPAVDRKAMASAELMGSVYWRLLRKLERRQFAVFGPTPTRLNRIHKLLLIGRTWYRLSVGACVPDYGVP